MLCMEYIFRFEIILLSLVRHIFVTFVEVKDYCLDGIKMLLCILVLLNEQIMRTGLVLIC